MIKPMGAALAVLALLCAPPVRAGTEPAWSVEGYVTLGSDYVWRGVTQTDGKPALHGELGLYHPSGFYAQAWAGRMDFGVPGDGIRYEVDLVAGWRGELTEGLDLDVSVLRALFPGANPGYGIDYNEFAVALAFAGYYSFTVAWSDNLYRMGESATHYELAADWPLAESAWGVRAVAGYYDLHRIAGDRYSHANLGVYRAFGEHAELAVGYYKAFGYTDAFEESMGSVDQAKSRFVAELTWSF